MPRHAGAAYAASGTGDRIATQPEALAVLPAEGATRRAGYEERLETYIERRDGGGL